MEKLLILVPKVTNRLRYVLELVLHEQLGLGYTLETDKDAFAQYQGPKLAYGAEGVDNTLFFCSVGLLFEREISSQELKPFDFEGTKAIFPVYHKASALPFDLFAAVFYHVSRYEEYLPFAPDVHGRFEAESSVLYETGMLETPVVNLWVRSLGRLLAGYFPGIKIKKHKYRFVPTYDIDAAWAYKHKGFYRTIGAYARDFSQFDWDEIKLRSRVLFAKQPDPFDTFELQLELQKQFRLRPVYFILFAEYGHNDKNIPVRNTHFRNLIKQLGDYADIGIHPSYASFSDKQKLDHEIESLSHVVNRQITASRQHFLRMSLPATYQNLIELDVTDDYTMGYAHLPGFRAGIADSFQFYDLDLDVPTHLRVNPFTVMDGTLRDYMKLDPEKAIEALTRLIKTVKSVDGTFIPLWHNESLSDQKRWKGWLDVYRHLLREAV